MFRAFNLAACNWDGTSIEEGAKSNESNRNIVEKTLMEFLNNRKIDGTKMRDHWFPTIHADVFISHSHRDKTDAEKLASFLKQKFGLSSFIDSCVWRYADDLLKQIDNQYCVNPGGETYSYEKRNGSTSHVHMMLSTALGMMLDTTECTIFMNTPQSITSDDTVSKTKSPWIYYELSQMSMIRRQKPKRKKPLIENFAKRGALEAQFEIEYTVKLGDLTEITADDLIEWSKLWGSVSQEESHPLDFLYQIAPEKNRV
jgi:hypothetical protein